MIAVTMVKVLFRRYPPFFGGGLATVPESGSMNYIASLLWLCIHSYKQANFRPFFREKHRSLSRFFVCALFGRNFVGFLGVLIHFGGDATRPFASTKWYPSNAHLLGVMLRKK